MKETVLFLLFVVAMHCGGMEPGFFLLPSQPGFNKQFYMYIMTMWSRKPDFFTIPLCACLTLKKNLVLIFLILIQYVNIFII